MIQEVVQFINKHPILSVLWITLSIILIILISSNLFTKIRNITNTKAIQLINKEEAITIDLRSNDDFNKGHIINSINLIPSKIKNNDIKKLEKYKQKPIIIISTNGIEAIKPAKQLLQYGFEKIFILKEGITGWSKEKLPLVCNKK